jgi:3-hydroxybutyryl-CoA dehydrogenase
MRSDASMNETLAIAGSGAIACGLAASAAPHGAVTLWARSDASVARARAKVDSLCEKVDGADPTRVEVVADLDALSTATFVVEAITEELEAKTDLLGMLGRIVKHDAALATTTSSLPVGALAAASGVPERFVGLHVFNPVPRMKLVELVFADQTTQDIRDRARTLCDDLGKTAVEVPDIPGFVVNRLLFPYLFSAVDQLEETGMDPQAIDTAMMLGAGHPMGPLALLDFVGLDVSMAIGDEIGADVPQRIRDLVAEGRLGRKTGSGLTL